ncbi:MAG: hypothetical protein ABUT39_08885 [Acidobacteriota bacterium]
MPLTDVYTGADGALLFIGGDEPEGADATAVIDLEAFSLTEVGRVTSVEIRVDTDLEEFHEIGRRHASSLHPGNIHIHGKIGRAYINGALLYMLLGRGASPNNVAEPYVQPALAMNVVLRNPAAPGHRSVIDLYGVKFENWAFSLPEDDFVVESVHFKALRINVRDEEGSDQRVPAFPEAAA